MIGVSKVPTRLSPQTIGKNNKVRSKIAGTRVDAMEAASDLFLLPLLSVLCNPSRLQVGTPRRLWLLLTGAYAA